MEGGMDSAGGRIDKLSQRVRVGGFKLGERAKLDQLAGQGMCAGQLLERVGIGGVAAFALLDPLDRELQFGEQDLAELDGRVEIELAAGGFVALHLRENRGDRNFDFAKELVETLRDELWRERIVQRRNNFRFRQRFARPPERGEVFVIQIVERRLGAAGIDQESGEHRIEIDSGQIDSEPAKAAQMRLQIVAGLWRSGLGEQGRGVAKVGGGKEMRFAARV